MGRLVLARKEGQRIWLGDDICIEIAHLGSEQVKLLIVAPDDVKIFREELLRKQLTNTAPRMGTETN